MRNQTHPVIAKKNNFRFTKIMGAIASTSILATGVAHASADYAPAIWRPTCNPNYYTTGHGHKFHVIHDMEGFYGGVVSQFTACGYTAASVHYAVNSGSGTSGWVPSLNGGAGGTATDTDGKPPGEITQMVNESYYAWHALGCWSSDTSGTEHEGFASNPAWYTEAQYVASASLTKHLCDHYGFAKDRNHIVGHEEGNPNIPQWAAWRAWAGPNLGVSMCQTHSDPGSYWDWTHYMALVNGNSTPPPPAIDWNVTAVIKNNDGRLELFAVGQDSAIYHNWQTAPNGGFSGWFSLGGGFLCEVAAGKNADGRPEVFALGLNGNAFTSWVQANGSWSAWVNLGGNLKRLSAGPNNADGHMEIFGIGADGQCYHNYQLAPNGNWSGWFGMGGTLSTKDMVIGKNLDGHLEIFAIATNNQPVHSFQNAPNGVFSIFWGMGGTVFDIDVASNSDGRLELFAVGNGGVMYHNWQTAANGPFSGWYSLGGAYFTKVSSARNLDGRLEVFGMNAWGDVFNAYQWQNSWTSWGARGGTVRNILATANADGHLETFATASDNQMWHQYQTSPNGSAAWTGWFGMGGSLK